MLTDVALAECWRYALRMDKSCVKRCVYERDVLRCNLMGRLPLNIQTTNAA